MNRDNERQSAIILSVIGIIPVVWLARLIAPSVKGGLPEILPSLLTAFNEPFHIELCEDSLKTVLVLLLCYAMGIRQNSFGYAFPWGIGKYYLAELGTA